MMLPLVIWYGVDRRSVGVGR